MRTKRIERLLRLIQLLQSGQSRTVDELAAHAGVSRRTIFRDIELLSRAGVRYTYDRLTRQYRGSECNVLPPVGMTVGECLALLLATRHALTYGIVPDPQAAACMGLKVEGMLPRTLQDHCGPLLDHVEFKPPPTSDAGAIQDTFAVLQTATTGRQKVFIRYDSYYEGHPIELKLHPYRLAFLNRGWYVIGHSERHGQSRTFKIERVLQIRLLGERFEAPGRFRLDDYFGNAWHMIRGPRRYVVRVRFSPRVAGNVDEVLWHKTQQTHYEPDGSLIFEVCVDGIDEIQWWILGYGAEAEVLEPEKLREAIGRHARAMYERYHVAGKSRSLEEDGSN